MDEKVPNPSPLHDRWHWARTRTNAPTRARGRTDSAITVTTVGSRVSVWGSGASNVWTWRRTLPFVTSCRQERGWWKRQRSSTSASAERRGGLRRRAPLPEPPTTQRSANDSRSERKRQKIKQSRTGSSQGKSSARQQISAISARLEPRTWQLCGRRVLAGGGQVLRPKTWQVFKQHKHNSSGIINKHNSSSQISSEGRFFTHSHPLPPHVQRRGGVLTLLLGNGLNWACCHSNSLH